MVSIVGLIILVFGYNYSHLALDLYGGKIISDGIGKHCCCLFVNNYLWLNEFVTCDYNHNYAIL